METRLHFSVIGDIPLPDGNRFLVGTGAKNTVSRGDIFNFMLDGHAVTIRVLDIGMRTAERVEKGIDGLLVQVEPSDTLSLVGRRLEFSASPTSPNSWEDLPLPQSLRLNLEFGFPLSTAQKARFATLCGAGVESSGPKLYEMESILRENRLWASEHVHFYLGQKNPMYMPGDIDPRLAVIIGEAEPDSPIALDYRVSPPRVVYLGGDGHESYWMEIAPDYESLISAISAPQ